MVKAEQQAPQKDTNGHKSYKAPDFSFDKKVVSGFTFYFFKNGLKLDEIVMNLSNLTFLFSSAGWFDASITDLYYANDSSHYTNSI